VPPFTAPSTSRPPALSANLMPLPMAPSRRSTWLAARLSSIAPPARQRQAAGLHRAAGGLAQRAAAAERHRGSPGAEDAGDQQRVGGAEAEVAGGAEGGELGYVVAKGRLLDPAASV